MKKHIIAISILIIVLALTGVGIWLVVRHNNSKPLYKVTYEFISSEDTYTLSNNILKAENLYQSKVLSSETRLTTLHTIITKIDAFEEDLNSYLLLSSSTSSTTRKLNKNYKSLTKKRSYLITNYNEYITRMSGNINISGTALNDLYDDIFNKTVEYIYKYNSCFKSTSSYVFNKVYKVDNIKNELYLLYSLGVNNLLNNISNNQFTNTNLIARLNNGIKLVNGSIYIVESIKGGEFSPEALKFKHHFANSNLDTLIQDFETYYNSSININNETSSEKLAVYYAKIILEI